MVILVQKLVKCNLVVNSEINDEKEMVIVEGNGYYKEEDNCFVIYFTDNESKYKYLYKDNKLHVYCNNSYYIFEENKQGIGEIKNGNFSLKITTFASKIQMSDNLIVLDYTLSQENIILGTYNSVLSFK